MIVFTSDWHLHPFRSYSTITEGGFNSRLWEQVSVIMGIVNWSNEHGASHLVHLGDIFHAQGETLNKDAIRAAHILFDKINANKIIIPGNHDQYRGKTVLRPFKHQASILVNPQVINIEGIDFGFIPYRRRLSEFEADLKKVEGANVLCCHQFFAGTRVGPDEYGFVLKDAFPKELVAGFDQVIAGHCHKHQTIDNIYYIGAPQQMTHGFEGDQNGFMIYTDKLEFIPISAPTFHTIDIDTEEDHRIFMQDYVDGNYYRVILNGSLNVQFPDTNRIEITRKRQARSASRVTIDKKPMEEVIIEAIANYPLDEDIDKEMVTKAALEIWKECDE